MAIAKKYEIEFGVWPDEKTILIRDKEMPMNERAYIWLSDFSHIFVSHHRETPEEYSRVDINAPQWLIDSWHMRHDLTPCWKNAIFRRGYGT